MNKKKLGVIALIVALALAAAGLTGWLLSRSRANREIDETVNLVKNSGFEEVEEGGTPRGWGTGRWFQDTGITYLEISQDACEGAYSILVENVEENDARFEQTVSVAPNAFYRIRCMIKAEGIRPGRAGASISIDNTFISSEYIYDTEGTWVPVEFYGKTGPKQTSMTIMCRVGGYGSLNSGKAWFDALTVNRVASLPPDVTALPLATISPVTPTPADDEEKDYTAWIVAVAILWLAIAALVLIRLDERQDGPRHRAVLIALCAMAALIRLYFAGRVRGYPNDISCFTAWADRMFQVGPFHFYATGFCDYPPGYMLLLWPVGALRALFGITADASAGWLSVKLIPMACDFLGAYLLHRTAKKRFSERVADILALIYVFNPAAVLDSALWGQVDSVLALCLVAAICLVVNEKWLAGMLTFTAAILIKPQALLFAPVGVMAMISEVWRCKEHGQNALRLCRDMAVASLARIPSLLSKTKKRKPELEAAYQEKRALWLGRDRTVVALRLALDMAACVLCAILFALPFSLGSGQNPVSWLVGRYASTMTSYNYITINAANLYNLLGMNWRQLEKVNHLVVVFSNFMYVLSFGYAFFLVMKGGQKKRLYLICCAAMALIFAFCGKMHERYLFPVLLMLLLAYAEDRDARILLAFVTCTVSIFLNSAMVLQDHDLPSASVPMSSVRVYLSSIMSVITLLNAAILTVTAFDVCIRGHVVALSDILPAPRDAKVYERKARGAMRPVLFREDAHLHMRGVDYLLMAAITLIYSVLAFTNLGDTAAPQTSWTSTRGEETVTFDLGEVRTFHLTYYGGICNSTFTVSTSEDGVEWTQEEIALYKQGEIFKWLWFTPYEMDEEGNFTRLNSSYPLLTARYVRLKALKAGLVLSEVGFLSEEGETLPILRVSAAGGSDSSPYDPALLADEQGTVPDHPSYMNSMYFDEIYHGRTGYEFLHGMVPYETTHPPLGKVLIMLGIQLFGMTPFGWRFMGALFGVLMLPVFYLLIKQLLKKTEFAAVGTFLFAVDAMHFTQTRIATIDTYGVFFILLMYLFMFRYAQMNFYFDPFEKTLLPLGLSGVAMGLGIASKWICIYAAVGLAVLFFYTLGRRYAEYRQAMRSGANSRAEIAARRHFWRYFWYTGAFCVVFFIVIPLVIYYFSYYWYMKPLGGLSVSGVWNRQISMLNYHKGLSNDTHTFMSKWYEWPLIVRPIWFYSGTAFMPAGMVSSISCMGNPAVWWGGLLALIFVTVHLLRGKGDRTHLYLVISFLAQYLPWVLVPRSTFIYHYFASVPFIIVCIVVFIRWMQQRRVRGYKVIVAVYMVIALLLFAAFYPLESGVPAARSYVQYLRWFHWINF